MSNIIEIDFQEKIQVCTRPEYTNPEKYNYPKILVSNVLESSSFISNNTYRFTNKYTPIKNFSKGLTVEWHKFQEDLEIKRQQENKDD